VQNQLPAILARDLRGVRRHGVLAVRDDLEELLVGLSLRLPARERRRRRESVLDDEAVRLSLRPVARLAEGGEEDRAALVKFLERATR